MTRGLAVPAALTIAALQLAPPLAAQAAAGAARDSAASPLPALRPGQELRIAIAPTARRTNEPAVRRAVVRAHHDDSLRVKLHFSPEERTFAVRQLERIDTLVIEHPRSRNIRNGVIVGAAFGPFAGIPLAKFAAALCEWDCPSRRQVYVSGIATGLVAGALLGGVVSVVFPRQTEWGRVYP